MITRETDYAIRVLLFLVEDGSEGNCVSSADVAKRMGIPYRFLRKIVRRLVVSGLVLSRRGKNGGLRLARPCSQISLLDVMSVFEPHGAKLNLCLEDKGKCHRSAFCLVHRELARVQDELDARLRHIPFSHFVAEVSHAAG